MQTFFKEDITYFVKPQLGYLEFLRWQAELTEVVRNDSSKKFIILCNHPLLATMGRGDRQNQMLGLTSTLPENKNIPLHFIKRGGGLTIHGPHQLIVYPILKLSPDFGLNAYLEWLQTLVRSWVIKLGGPELEYRRNPLGLWFQEKKVASIGVGVERFVTNHGLALNVEEIPSEVANLSELNPCGLASETYTSLETLGKAESGASVMPAARVADFFEMIAGDQSDHF